MSADSNDKSGGLSANWPPMVLVALLAAGVIVKNVPLESARPSDAERTKSIPLGQQNVEARLWQDPLAAVRKHIESTATSPNIDDCSLQLKELREGINRKLKLKLKHKHDFAVVAVSVPGGSFYEEAEWRRRSRFAVISALGFYRYTPQNADALGFFTIPHIGLKAGEEASQSQASRPTSSCHDLSEQLIVPFEWFQKEREGTGTSKDTSSQLLVLWLNEDKLVTLPEPLSGLMNLFEKLDPALPDHPNQAHLSRIPIKVIGPTSSKMLIKLIQGEGSAVEKILEGRSDIQLFVPSATFPICDTDSSLAQKQSQSTFSKYLCEPSESLKTLPIVRVTGTDDILAIALQWELWQRGVNKDAGIEGNCTDGLVLIHESDTEYGRTLSRYLAEGFEARCRTDLNNKGSLVREFTYLRGLDGLLPDLDKLESRGSRKENKDEGESSKNLRAQLDDALKEHAEGRNQYDYLRRLADKIEQLDKDKKFSEKGVKAIGIVGTDVYDKFLILQALRPRFKDKIFFTTDLDARYLHADQQEWTRNLVVASNFDLSLNSALQQSTPPFRTSYQTATYLATLIALSSNDEGSTPEFWAGKMKSWLRPQIFEIGRTEAVHLASPAPDELKDWIKSNNVINKATVGSEKCESTWIECKSIEPYRPPPGLLYQNLKLITLIGIFGITLIALTNRGAADFLRRLFSPNEVARRQARANAILMLGSMTIVVAILEGVRLQANSSFQRYIGEPFLWLEGVSVWPSLVLRFFGSILMLMLIIVLVKKMWKSTFSIGGRFDLKLRRSPRSCAGLSWKLKRSYWEAICKGPNHDLTPFDIDGKIKSNRKGTEKEENHVAILWRNYVCVTCWRHMAPWVTACTILMMGFGWSVFQLFGDPPSFPHRGQLVQILNIILVTSNVIILWLTITWVSYETKACAGFVHILSNGNHRWPSRVLNQQQTRTGIPKEYLNRYLSFKLIVRVTTRIQGLIYLPFILIFFMVLARSDLFDAMNFPLPLVIVIGLALVYALNTVRVLHRNAEDARDRVLAYYKNLLLRLGQPGFSLGNDGVSGTSKEQVKELIENINSVKDGVYAGVTRQPWIQALLLPFGGYSGVQLVEILLNW